MLYNWQDFLTQWNIELLKSEDVIDNGLSPEVEVSHWFGYPASTEQQIATAEARLGRELPPSYRQFLQFSNGWRQTGSFIYKLWTAEEVNWFRVRNQEWIDILLEFEDPEVSDTDYLVYGDNVIQPQRIEYLQTALEIRDVGDAAVYLLNPQIVTPEGEWEAWFLASWNGSIERYPPFWEMMQSEYRRFLKLNALDAKRFRVNGDPGFLFTKISRSRFSHQE